MRFGQLLYNYQNFRFEENADSYIPNSTIRYSKDKTKGGEAIVDTIIINRKHLDNKNDFIKIVDSIIDLAKSGKYKYPFFISDNKQNHLELTESQLIKIIKTCIDEEIAKNNCRKKTKRKYERIGKYLIVKGDNLPHTIKGMEQYENNLYDKTMYTSPDETICVFSVGNNTNKRICFRLEYEKSTRMWLGFTPLEVKDVPVLIRQHS